MPSKHAAKVESPQELLQDSPAKQYEPSHGYYGNFHYLGQHGRPPFDPATIVSMLTDPRVIYGLWLIKGPIMSDAHVKVECPNEQIRQFVITQINRFWQNSAVRALKAIEWGYSCAEVIYREKDGQVQFDELRDFHSPDCRLITKDGNIRGVLVKNSRVNSSGGSTDESFDQNLPPQRSPNNVYIGIPKSFVHIHWRDRNRFYGLSRLFGAHLPWWEIWSSGGYRDVRRLWFYKNAFEGGTMRHPPGMAAPTEQGGVPRANKDIARELIEKKRSGGVLTLSNQMTGDGKTYAWDHIPAQSNPAPEGLLEYGTDLRDEILEALGIPPEIVASGGDQGFGSSTGRQVPQLAFYAILQELLQWLVTDLHNFLIKPLVDANYGEGQGETVELLPFKLSEDIQSGGMGGMGDEMGGGMEGDFNGNQFQDENQRGFGGGGGGRQPRSGSNTMMAYCSSSSPEKHVRINGRWWTKKDGVLRPMTTAI